MAEKGWTSQVAAAAGAAAGTGAAQLGLGYGLGVVVWPVVATPDDNVWLGSLGWATWITASATVIGAVIASRLPGPPARLRALWRLALAASAAVGALVAVALIALPARSAVRADTFSPQVTAGGYALLGVVLGVLVAYWAIASRPVAANLIGTAVWLWALAIAAIVVELTAHRTSATYLTSWQFAEAVEGFRYGSINWPSGLLTLAAAFLVGIAAAAPAARRGDFGVGATISGAVGPLLVAAAFLALAPQLTGTLGPLESAYLIAPYAVLAGLAGSALAVAMGRAAADRRARRAEPAGTDGDTDQGDGHSDAQDAGDDGQSGSDRPRDGEAAGRSAPGIAAVPAADFANPTAVAPKTKAQPSTGRAKLPTRQTPATGPATDPPAAGSASRPADSSPGPAADARSSRAPDARSENDRRPAAPGPKPGGRNGQSTPPPVDPEIAAAARPGRARPKRPASAEVPATKSTVTPPPTDPTIARINPKDA